MQVYRNADCVPHIWTHTCARFQLHDTYCESNNTSAHETTNKDTNNPPTDTIPYPCADALSISTG